MSDDPIKNAVDGLLLEASVAVAKLDWPTVAALADAVLKLDPENVDALKLKSLTVDQQHAEPGSTETFELKSAVAQAKPILRAAPHPSSKHRRICSNCRQSMPSNSRNCMFCSKDGRKGEKLKTPRKPPSRRANITVGLFLGFSVLFLVIMIAISNSSDDSVNSSGRVTASDPVNASTPIPTTAPVVQSFSGTGDSVIRSVSINSGVLVVTVQHRGSSNFQVWVIGSDSKELSFNEIGNFTGTVAHAVSQGSYSRLEPGTVLIEITADGSWTIDMTQEWPTAGQSPPIDLNSRGQAVLKWLRFPSGNYVLNARHSGSSNFQIHLMKSDGSYTELVVNEIGNYSGENLLQVSKGSRFGMDAGLYALAVVADGDWSITIR